jgi:hypothetical protein
VRQAVAVSPHLDDAVFSAGGTLAALAAAGWRVRVVTCFTASVADPSPFALSTQLDKGLGAEIDYMALRRAEDAAALQRLGAEPVHLPLPEAPHRGYTSAPDLFAGQHADDDVTGPLTEALARACATPSASSRRRASAITSTTAWRSTSSPRCDRTRPSGATPPTSCAARTHRRGVESRRGRSSRSTSARTSTRRAPQRAATPPSWDSSSGRRPRRPGPAGPRGSRGGPGGRVGALRGVHGGGLLVGSTAR